MLQAGFPFPFWGIFSVHFVPRSRDEFVFALVSPTVPLVSFASSVRERERERYFLLRYVAIPPLAEHFSKHFRVCVSVFSPLLIHICTLLRFLRRAESRRTLNRSLCEVVCSGGPIGWRRSHLMKKVPTSLPAYLPCMLVRRFVGDDP